MTGSPVYSITDALLSLLAHVTPIEWGGQSEFLDYLLEFDW